MCSNRSVSRSGINRFEFTNSGDKLSRFRWRLWWLLERLHQTVDTHTNSSVKRELSSMRPLRVWKVEALLRGTHRNLFASVQELLLTLKNEQFKIKSLGQNSVAVVILYSTLALDFFERHCLTRSNFKVLSTKSLLLTRASTVQIYAFLHTGFILSLFYWIFCQVHHGQGPQSFSLHGCVDRLKHPISATFIEGLSISHVDYTLYIIVLGTYSRELHTYRFFLAKILSEIRIQQKFLEINNNNNNNKYY